MVHAFTKLCLLLLWIQLPGLALAAQRPDFASLEHQRKVQHLNTQAALAKLNALRFKFIELEKDTLNLAQKSQELSTRCQQSAFTDKVEDCFLRSSHLGNSALIKLGQLESWLQSSSLREASHQEILRTNESYRLITSLRAGLSKTIEAARRLETTFGKRLAKIRLRAQMGGLEAKITEARKRAACFVVLDDLNGEIRKDLFSQAEKNSNDPSLVLRREVVARQILASVEALQDDCSTSQPKLMSEAARLAERALKMSPPTSEVIRLAELGCTKIKSSGDAELSKACREKDFNPEVLYSISRKLSELRSQR